MKLFPRIARRFAEEVYAERCAMSPSEVRATGSVRHAAMTWPATGAARVSDAELETLASELRSVADRFGYPQPPAPASRPQIDFELARILAGSELSPAEASFPDVWSFL